MNNILALSGCQGYPESLMGENAYLRWRWLQEGIVKIEPLDTQTKQHEQDKILISTGIHGNETAPIEIAAQLVCQLLNGDMPLKVSLLVVFGNIKAIAAGQRFLDADLNRMFNGGYKSHHGTAESLRALEIENHVKYFFSSSFVSQKNTQQHFHFDLHTAIRGSVYQKFALLPQKITTQHYAYLNWITAMGLTALVVNLIPSGTFSSFTSHVCNAISCTIELGKAKPFGNNKLTHFSDLQVVLTNLLCGRDIQKSRATKPTIFVVQQEIIKYSNQFKFIAVDEDVKNFTCYPKGTQIAIDQSVNYQVKHEFEWILFPNALVSNGLRAGILLVEGDTENIKAE